MTRIQPGVLLKTRVSGHGDGCDCEPCVSLRRRNNKVLTMRPALVPIDRVRAKFTEWEKQHYTTRHIGHVTGVDRAAVLLIIDGKQARIAKETEARVLASQPTPENAPKPTSFVPAIGATRRLQGLMAIGYTRTVLKPRLPRINLGLLAAGRITSIHRQTWENVRDVYEELCMTPGPSEVSRKRAAKAGYAPPLAWDEGMIDDPDARPTL